MTPRTLPNPSSAPFAGLDFLVNLFKRLFEKPGILVYLAGLCLIVYFWLGLGTFAALWARHLAQSVEPLLLKMVLENASSVFLLAGLFLAMRLVQRRSFRSLLGRQNRLQPAGIFLSGLAWVLPLLIFALIHRFTHSQSYQLSAITPQWVSAVFFGGLLVTLQAGAEELLFRGYLLKLFALPNHKKTWLALLSSLVFALLHLLSAPTAATVLPRLTYFFIFGLFLAILTLYEKHLGKALGIHIAHNFFYLFIVGWGGGQSDLALFQAAGPSAWGSVGMLLGAIAIYAPTVYTPLRTWAGWKRLFKSGGQKARSLSLTVQNRMAAGA